MKWFPSIIVAAACAALLAACASPTPTPTISPVTAPPSSTAQPQRGLAVVDRIEVFPPSGPADPARVTAHGQLADSCTVLAGSTVDRQAQTFIVTLSTLRQVSPVCSVPGQTFSQDVVLDVSSAPAGSYVVVVNGVTGSLTLTGAAPAATSGAPVSGTSPTPAASITAAASTVAPSATTIAPATATASAAPTSSPTGAATPAPTATSTGPGSAAGCTNKGAFYGDVTVPDDSPFKQGEKFTKTWKVRNEGTCAWQGYALVFAGGDNMSAPLSATLPSAAPATVVQVSMDFVAPTRGGEQIGNWQFQDEQGNRFGVGATAQGPLWVKITVAYSGQENVATPSAGNSCGAARNSAFEGQVLALLSAQRVAAGLGAVAMQPQLAAAAAQHSFDMACNDFISHAGTDGSSWKNRVSGQGYANANSAREIIYAGDLTFGADPPGAVGWWMNSPVHHDIVLYPTVTQLGIAVAVSPNKPNWGYYTVVFAWP